MFTVTYLEIIFGVTAYHFINHYLQHSKINLSNNKIFKQFVLLHNVLLTVYSGMTYMESTKIVLQLSTRELFSDKAMILYDNNHYQNLLYFFYLSKYWEFFDTWTHYLKGRQPSYFQVYHHTGAVLMMGTGYINQVISMWLFITFNSFVHTIMYTYYALSCLKIKVPYKKWITSLQIVQLCSAISMGWYYFFFTNMPVDHKVCLVLSTGYIFGLIEMFTSFYRRNY